MRLHPLLTSFGRLPRGDTLRAQMVRAASGTLMVKVANSGLMLLISLALARALGAAGYGTYAYTVSWIALLAIPATLGFGRLLTREFARYRAIEAWGSMRGILRWSDRLVLSLSLAISAAGAAAIWWWRPHLDPTVANCFLAGMVLLPFMSILQVRAAASRGLGQVVGSQIPMMVVLPGGFLVAVMAMQLTTGLTAVGAVSLRVAAAAVAVVMALLLLSRFMPAAARRAAPQYHKRMWLGSVVPFLFLAASEIMGQQIGIVMLGSLSGPEAAGIYDIARRAALLVGLAVLAVNMPLGPVVAGLYARGETARLQRIVVKSARVAAAGSCLIALALIVLGPWLLGLFGREFRAGLPVLVILCVGQILNAAAGSVALLLNMTGHERDAARSIGIAAVSQVCFNAVLIPRWDMLGAATGEAASTVLWNVMLIYWAWRRIGLRATVLGGEKKRIPAGER